MSEPRWLDWARRVAMIAQEGLTYSDAIYDRDRYQRLLAVAAEMVADHADPGAPVRPEELFPDGSSYPTPKVDVRGFVMRDGEVLLVREASDGRWSLPGGWADLGTTPAEMVAREVCEESGYVVRPARLLAVWDCERHNTGRPFVTIWKVVLDCELEGGEPAASHETLDVGWFSPAALPELSTGRTTAAQIRRLVHLHDHPEEMPDFD